VTKVNTADHRDQQRAWPNSPGATALQNQLTFVQNLQDTLDTGIGNLVNANSGKESAQLTAPADKATAWHPGAVDRQPVELGALWSLLR